MSHPSRCTVAYTDSDGILHEVQVWANSVYSAVGEAIQEFRAINVVTHQPARMTEFTVTVHRQPSTHKVRMQQVENWSIGGGTSPQDTSERNRVRAQLVVDSR